MCCGYSGGPMFMAGPSGAQQIATEGHVKVCFTGMRVGSQSYALTNGNRFLFGNNNAHKCRVVTEEQGNKLVLLFPAELEIAAEGG